MTELLLSGLVLPFSRPCVLGRLPRFRHRRRRHTGPGSGSWHTVRLRGTLSVADDYVVTELENALHRAVLFPWSVRRIVPVAFHGRRGGPAFVVKPPTEALRFTRTAVSYLVDLQAVGGTSGVHQA